MNDLEFARHVHAAKTSGWKIRIRGCAPAIFLVAMSCHQILPRAIPAPERAEDRGPHYVPKPEYAGPNGIPLFYSLPKTYDFYEVANRSECVGYYVAANV